MSDPNAGLSKVQKAMVFTYAAFMILAIFAHNPIKGYWNNINERNFEYKMNYANSYLEKVDPRCWSDCWYVLPIMDWKSKSALFEWISYVSNLVWVGIIFSILAAIGFVFFSKKSEDKNES